MLFSFQQILSLWTLCCITKSHPWRELLHAGKKAVFCSLANPLPKSRDSITYPAVITILRFAGSLMRTASPPPEEGCLTYHILGAEPDGFLHVLHLWMAQG